MALSAKPKVISIVFGTRPEFIKLFPVIKAFRDQGDCVVDVCFTGQHMEMVHQLQEFFQIPINVNLDLMESNQTLAGLTSKAITALNQYFIDRQPDVVFVQGDTTTALCAAQAAFYQRRKVAHVEAGLRTYDIFSPFPEEFNRQIISKVATLHFAPTEAAKRNLLRDGVAASSIFVTGNTVIDALLFTRKKLEQCIIPEKGKYPWDESRRCVLITGHRRESFGEGFENICKAIRQLSLKYPDYNFVYPVHLNPNVQEPVNRLLNGLTNVYLTAPLDYMEFTALMSRCYLVLTDSGGVQEEAPSLNKPVLIMREHTERSEVIAAGAARLVGTDSASILHNVVELIENQTLYDQMSAAINPFGDGNAADRIVAHTLQQCFPKNALCQ